MKKFVMILAAMAACGAALAADPAVRALSVQEMAYRGATHAIELNSGHFTVSADDGTQTNTFTVSGPCVWEYVGMEVSEPFDASSVTNSQTLSLTFLAGSDTLANGIEAALDATRPYKFSRASPAATTTVTPTTTVITNVVGDVTNLYTVAVAANTAATTLSTPYTGIVTNGGSVTFTIIADPSAEVALNKVDAGRAAFFLRLWK